jgi:hypothetical protein
MNFFGRVNYTLPQKFITLDFATFSIFVQKLCKAEFKKVRVDDSQYTICWPNGADFCPDVLYESGEEVELNANKQKKAINKQSQAKARKFA